jgi:putative transposase
MAEWFVKTMKLNYVAFMDKPDAPTALSRLAITFEHYNERHPHKALKVSDPLSTSTQQHSERGA